MSNKGLFPDLTFMVLSLHLLLVTCCTGCLLRWSSVWAQGDNSGHCLFVAFFPPGSVPCLVSPLMARILTLGKGCSNVTLLFLDNDSKHSGHTIPDLLSIAGDMLLLWSHTWLYITAELVFEYIILEKQGFLSPR